MNEFLHIHLLSVLMLANQPVTVGYSFQIPG
jgi:hypothetical protein